MIQQLKASRHSNEILILLLFSIFCLIFSLFRVSYSNTKVFLFLNWNLFLAAIPYVLSSIVMLNIKLQEKKWVIGIVLASWLLFFPNAPYILTDLLHLKRDLNMPVWFDLILILSFAWTGLLFGFLSLRDIDRLFRKNFNKSTVFILITLLLFAAGFGIYLGRYLRWNSWDILQNPMGLVFDIGDRFIDPFSHPRTWGLTIFMGIFLNMVYWSMKQVRFKSSEE